VTVLDAWPPGRPRVLVTDSWLANSGDAAITLGVDTMVRRLAPTASILHASYQYAEVGPLLPGLRFVAPLEDLLGSALRPAAPAWAGVGQQLVAEADLVICQAGGAFMEPYKPFARFPPLADVAERGIPLVVLGASIGPFVRAPARRDLGRLLRQARLVTVRDPLSMAIASDLGAADVVFGSDPALALFDGPPGPSDRSGISVILTDHHPVEAQRSRVRQAARLILDEVIRGAEGTPLHLWSTVQGLPQLAREDDAGVSAGLLDDLDRPEAVTEGAPTYIDPRLAIAKVASSQAVVTMRLHPSLFAASTATPFALILDGQRTGVWAGAHQHDRIANPFQPAAVSRVVHKALSAEPDPMALWRSLQPLRDRLDDTVDRLASVLQDL
jgi:hypothetical protein